MSQDLHTSGQSQQLRWNSQQLRDMAVDSSTISLTGEVVEKVGPSLPYSMDPDIHTRRRPLA